MSSIFSNLWLGFSEFNFSNITEKDELTIQTPSEYLNNIQYVVDIHIPKSEISSLLSSNVGVAYTTEGEDFKTPDSNERGNVKIYQETSGYTLDFPTEKIGRYSSNLKGNYLQHVNIGADDIKLDTDSARLSPNSGHTTGPITIPFNKTDGSNVQCSAIARAISSQMEGFAFDENLLRLVATANTYNNLLTFSLSGSIDNNGGVKVMHELLRGNTAPENSYHGTVYETLNNSTFNENREISDIFPGHLIVAAIFNAHPPRADGTVNYDVNNNNVEINESKIATSDRLWVRKDVYNNDQLGDILVLNKTGLITEKIVLQFVLQTSMTLISRENTPLNKTKASPSSGLSGYKENTVHILYNLIFDIDA